MKAPGARASRSRWSALRRTLIAASCVLWVLASIALVDRAHVLDPEAWLETSDGVAPASCEGTTLRYLSFWDENRYEPNDFAGWANLGFTRNASSISRGSALGISHLYKVHGVFFSRGDPEHPTRGALRLRPDYASRWAEERATTVDALWDAEAIMGFYLGDELVWNGLSVDDVDAAARSIRAAFPSAII